MFPIYKKDRDFIVLLPKCIFSDFVREEILSCPMLTKVKVYGYTLRNQFKYFHFIRTQDGFRFDLSNSSEMSKLIVWNYAYLLKTWTLNAEIFFNFVDTEFHVHKPMIQLKTAKANVIVAPRCYMERNLNQEPDVYWNKNGIRTQKERIVHTLNELLC
ncbi:hypothetical protein TNCT_729921 [Trichonephila clavata]|uniref:Uncharacterized protein n=1 Tax=Trichonephila clavata TaxID=2740835 RepID=A0A8X6FVM5_TRICU|nr:hypothetical protein TNCT_729921 [Trichonephila clavata]